MKKSLPALRRTISTVFARCSWSVFVFLALYFNVGVLRDFSIGFTSFSPSVLNCSSLEFSEFNIENQLDI